MKYNSLQAEPGHFNIDEGTSANKRTVCTILQKYASEYEDISDVYALKEAIINCIRNHRDEIYDGEADKAIRNISRCRNVGHILSTLGTYLTTQKVNEKRGEIAKSQHAFEDLWDQVYCSLTDGGINSAYDSLGSLSGKNRYDKRAEIEVGGYRDGYDIITIISPNLDYARQVAEIYELDTRYNPRKGSLSIYIPEDAPARIDIINKFKKTPIAPKVRAQGTNLIKTCDDYGYSCAYLPAETALKLIGTPANTFASPVYYKVTIGNGDTYILAVDNTNKLFIESETNTDSEPKFSIDDKKLFSNATTLFNTYKDNLNQIKQLNNDSQPMHEDAESSMPIAYLPQAEIRDFIEAIPTPARGVPPRPFSVGYARELTGDIASKYRGGRNASTDDPVVRILKCEEMRVTTGYSYEAASSVKNYREITGIERSGDRSGFNYGAEGSLVNKIGMTSGGNYLLSCFIVKGSKPSVKYYISVNNADFVEATKEEIAQYLTGSGREKILNGVEPRIPGYPDNYRRLVLSKIYKIGNLGHSVF